MRGEGGLPGTARWQVFAMKTSWGAATLLGHSTAESTASQNKSGIGKLEQKIGSLERGDSPFFSSEDDSQVGVVDF